MNGAPNAKYRRIVELGRGGMAIVHLAAMRSSHNVTKLVVVKELQPERAADPEYRTMFVDEARLATRLNHPNVIQTFEIIDHVTEPAGRPAGEIEIVCALVMEYLEGQALNRVRARLKDDPRALGVHLAVLIDALSGLDYAHSLADYEGRPLHIVHRDVSPHNIFLTYSGEVKVLDFGIAKAADASSAPTQLGTVKGKLGYMAPEQARGDRVDLRADVFSVGVMLWEAVVQRRLWAGLNEPAIMYKLSTGDIPAPRDVRSDVPAELDAICRRALAHDPDMRHPSAIALRDDIEAFNTTLVGRPSRRSLGDLVLTLFTAERAQVRRIVEEQLGRISAVDSAQFTSIPLPPPPRLPQARESSSAPLVPDRPSGPTQATAARSVGPDRRGRLGIVIGAVSLAIALSALVVVLVILKSNPASPRTTQNDRTEPIASLATPPLRHRRSLVLDPPTAIATLDGATLASGATTIEGRDPASLRVEASGYIATELRVTFDTTEPIIVRLVAAARPPPTTSAKQVAPPIGARTATPAPSTTKPASPSPTDVGY